MIDNNKQKVILIRCPNWVGDVIMATPALKCLRDNFKDAKIIAGIKKYAAKVLENSDLYDELFFWQDKSLKGFLNTVKALRKIKPDMTILLTNSFRSALTAKLIGSKEIIGYKRNFRSFLLTKGPFPKMEKGKIIPIPMSEYYNNICSFLNLEIQNNQKPILNYSEKEEQIANNLLQKYEIKTDELVIAINPGAKFGSSKCWLPEYFAKLTELIEKNIRAKILLLAGPNEKEISDSIVNHSKAKIINTYYDNIDLGVLKPIIKRCSLLITNDTGPRHYATALNIPHVVIMGPTNPAYTNAFNEKAEIILTDAKCAPCHKKICPTDHCCMKNILPETVLEKSLKLLKSEGIL